MSALAPIAVDLTDAGQPGRSITVKHPKSLSLRKFRELQTMANNDEDIDGGLKMLRQLVLSWDVDDDEGNRLSEVTDEAMETLPIGVLMHVSAAVRSSMSADLPKA